MATVATPAATADYEVLAHYLDGVSEQVKLLKNEVPVTLGAIEALLQQLEQRINNRLDTMNLRLDGVDTRLDNMNLRLDGRLDNMNARLDNISNSLDNTNNGLTDTNNRLHDLSDRLNLIPVQMYNTSLHMQAPLRYPASVVVVDGMPRTKSELANLSGANCQVTATALGVALTPHSTVAERRVQLSEYLGIM